MTISAEQEIVQVMQRVKHLLEKYPNTRNSDSYLIVLYLKYFAGWPIPWIEWDKMNDVSIESITRARRKFQEHGLFEPTDADVKRRRMRRERVFREVIGQT